MQAYHTFLMTCAELDARYQKTIEEIQARIDDYDERVSMMCAHIDTSDAATTKRAMECLERPERFHGERDLAGTWLRNYAPTARRIFERERQRI